MYIHTYIAGFPDGKKDKKKKDLKETPIFFGGVFFFFSSRILGHFHFL